CINDEGRGKVGFFAEWLQARPDKETTDAATARLTKLRAFVSANATDWPVTRNDPAPFLQLIFTRAAATDREELANTLSDYFALFRSESVRRTRYDERDWISANSGLILLIVFGAAVTVI